MVPTKAAVRAGAAAARGLWAYSPVRRHRAAAAGPAGARAGGAGRPRTAGPAPVGSLDTGPGHSGTDLGLRGDGHVEKSVNKAENHRTN